MLGFSSSVVFLESLFSKLVLAFREAKKIIQQPANKNNNKLVSRCYNLTMCFVLTEKNLLGNFGKQIKK